MFDQEELVLDIIMQDSYTHKLMNYQIQDVLEFAKMETKEFTIKLQRFNFRDLLEEMKQIFGNYAT